MAKSTRNRMVLVGAIAILALALSAVVPVLAQTGTGGTSGQAGSSVTIQSGDTLGTIVSRYNFQPTDLQDFFSKNTALVLTPGQTVTFPSGVTVNLPNGSSGTSGSSGSGSSSTSGQGAATATVTSGTGSSSTSGSGSTSATAQPTGTTAAGGTSGSGTSATAQPTGTTAAGGTSGSTSGSGSSASGSTSNSGSVFVTATPGQTYVTVANDTLGKVLGFMGWTGANGTSGSGSSSSGSSSSGTSATAQATGTMAAGGASGSGTSATAQPTGTTAAGAASGTSATAQPTGTMAAGTSGSGSGSTTGALTTQQLQEFVSLNQSLTFTPGQTAYMPATVTIPQTGAATSTSAAGAVATGTATTAAGTTGGSTTGAATSTPVAGGANSGSTTYTVQSGDTLQSIANRYGITVAQLVQMNPNLLTAGQTINVPSSTSGSIPQTGNTQSRTFTVQNNETLGAIVSRYNLGQRDLAQFFSANCGLTVQAGQTVRWPAGATINGSSTSNSGTSGSNSSSNSSSGSTSGSGTTAQGTATATPTAGTSGSTSGTTAQGTATATQAAGTSGSTSGTTAQGTATPTASTSGSGSSGSGSTSGSSASGNTSNQDTLLWNWYVLNRGLKLDNGQTVTVPAGIPATGGSASASGAQANVESAVKLQNYGLCSVGPGSGIYVVQRGDTLQSIAKKFGIQVTDITSRNPGVQSVSRGQHLLMPGVEGAGLWDNALLSNPYYPNCGKTNPKAPPSR